MRRPATDINTKQRRILDFIKDSLHNEYRCPTVREICTHVGLSSTSTVQSHLNALEKFGYIKRDPNKNRAITVLEDAKPSISVAGNEISSSDNFEFLRGWIKTSTSYRHCSSWYAYYCGRKPRIYTYIASSIDW